MSATIAGSPADSFLPGFTYSRLLKVAWLAVGLGLAMQVLTMLVLLLLSSSAPGAAAVLRDSLQKVSWATIVCTGLAVGSTAARSRAAWSGLVGLLSAPLAFIVARLVQKGVGQAVGAPAEGMATGIFLALLTIKAVEYGLLGVTLHLLSSRWKAGLAPHLLAGALAGLIFGGLVVATIALGASPAPNAAKLSVTAVNELVFPIGCSLALYASGVAAKRLANR